MESCNKYREGITELALGGPAGGEAAALEAHVAVCPECAALLAETRGMLAVLKGAELPEPREKFIDGLADRVYGELKESGGAGVAGGRVVPLRRGVGMLRALSALAAMLALVAGLMLLTRGVREPVANLQPEPDFSDTELADEIAAMDIFVEPDVYANINTEEFEAGLDVDLGVMALATAIENAELDAEDVEWVESGLGEEGMEGTETGFDEFFENISEEDAREILERLEDAGVRTAAPAGVS